MDSEWDDGPRLVLIKEEPQPITEPAVPPTPGPSVRPRLVLQDISESVYQDASGCSNCYAKVRDGGGKRLNEILCRRRAGQGDGDGQSLQVTVMEALDVIFEVTKKSSLSKVLLDEVNYTLCWKCTKLLAQLYKLFIEFVEYSQVPSFMQSIIVQNKPLRVYKTLIKKEYLSDDEEENTQHLDFEVELHEESTSYAPPYVSKYVFDDDYEDISLKDNEEDVWGNEPEGDYDSSEDYKIGGPLTRGKNKRVTRKSSTKSTPPVTPRKRGRPPGKTKPKYSCDECGEQFTKPYRLDCHLKVHMVKKHTCTQEGCNAGFQYKFQLDRHAEAHQGKKWKSNRGGKPKIKVTTVGRKRSKQDYVCKDCGLVFSKPSRLLRHEAVHAKKSFTCTDCDIGYKSEALLTRHNLRVHGTGAVDGIDFDLGEDGSDGEDGPPRKRPRQMKRERDRIRKYNCTECPAKFVRSDHLRRHVTVHSEKNHICTVCNAGFKALTHLERHLVTVHTDSPDAEVVARKQRRIRKPTPASTRTYHCEEDQCTSVFTRNTHLTRHLKEKHGIEQVREPDEPTACVVCGLIITTKSKMEKHLIKKHRPIIVVNKFSCEECGKSYRDRNNLRNHKLAHRNDKPYMCDVCGFATKRSYQLSRHVAMVHVGNRPFLCTTCGMSFKKRQHLRDHESKHFATEYRPFTCTFEGCTKAYRSKRNLSQHLDLHAGHKFICELCGRVFTRRDNLKVHNDTVHLGKPGRVQRDRVIRAASGAKPRKPRAPKKEELEEELILPDDDEEEDEDEDPDDQEGENLMVAEESLNLSQQHSQPHPSHHHLHHHILANPRLIPQPMIPGQNIVIPNAYGEFYYL